MPTLVEPDVDEARDLLKDLAPPCEAPGVTSCPESATWIVRFKFCHLCVRTRQDAMRNRSCSGHLLCGGHKDSALALTLFCPRCEHALHVKSVEAI